MATKSDAPRPEPRFDWFIPIDGDGAHIGTFRAERPPSFEYLRKVVETAEQLGYYSLQVLERSEEHTSELQSPYDLVCRLLLEKINIVIYQPRRRVAAKNDREHRPAHGGPQLRDTCDRGGERLHSRANKFRFELMPAVRLEYGF